MTSHPMTEDELQAYVDDVLLPERRAAVEAHLARHPADAERVAAYRAQKQALKALFQPVLDEPLPERLQALSVQPLRTPGGGGWTGGGLGAPWQRLVAGLLVAALGGVGGWLAHGQYGQDRMVRMVPLSHQAAVAHVVYSPEVRRPVEIAADQEEALVKWLSKRLGTPVRPPKLGGVGYELVGGRLLPGEAGARAQFMYEDAAGARVTLYVGAVQPGASDAPDATATAFRFAVESGAAAFYWVDQGFGYALVGNLPRAPLLALATQVYRQLER